MPSDRRQPALPTCQECGKRPTPPKGHPQAPSAAYCQCHEPELQVSPDAMDAVAPLIPERGESVGKERGEATDSPSITEPELAERIGNAVPADEVFEQVRQQSELQSFDWTSLAERIRFLQCEVSIERDRRSTNSHFEADCNLVLDALLKAQSYARIIGDTTYV